MGFPLSSVGKEFACNAGDPGWIPGLGRATGEGKGYPFQCSGLENPWVCRESDMTERLSFSLSTSRCMYKTSLKYHFNKR